MKRPTILCLTPVKNEAWILERFLQCASLWADHIIIADQYSDDGSLEIAKRFSKVMIVQNPSPLFNEPERQNILIEAARKFASPRLLITLDADEFLTPNFSDNSEWETVLQAPSGTVVYFRLANIKPNMRQYWSPPTEFPWGFIDDGSMHRGRMIHSPRIPVPDKAAVIKLRQIQVMHYQYVDWARMLSKHRWYQCWERLNNPGRSAVNIYRQYHHMDAIKSRDLQPIHSWWFEGYREHGIDMTSIPIEPPYRWDSEVLEYMTRFGARYFARDSIWDIDWKMTARQAGYAADAIGNFKDPRVPFLKILHQWLKSTQPHADRAMVRAIDKVLSRIY
jgi:glycosyltransferase involved in cell wall biosynthesis